MTVPPAVRRDRVVGVVLASAAADALGAPHEFGPPLPADVPLQMTGGGPFGWEPGEWTDDTQQSLAIVRALADGRGHGLVGAVEDGLRAWYVAGPNDVGSQTRGVLERDRHTFEGLAHAAAAYQAGHPESAGNGSLMRTGPVALAAPDDLAAVATLAAEISALTHPHRDAVDACVLWSVAIARALDGPTVESPNWVDLVSAGLDLLEPDRRGVWEPRLEACRVTPPELFTPNGWVVTALQAALASIAQTKVPDEAPPCTHLRLAVERAIRIGHDTDTVAAIASSLLGAHWGATAVPHEWRRTLHGEVTRDAPVLRLAELDRLARLAGTGGASDPAGWPAVESMLPHYRTDWSAPPLVVDLVEGVSIGNVHAVPTVVTEVDAVVSLCRMGTADVPAPVEHHVIGLLDSDAADNPNLAFVLADTADLMAALAAEGKRVFVHCVQAQNRTPTVAAGYLIRHHGYASDDALRHVESLIGTRPQHFLADAVRTTLTA